MHMLYEYFLLGEFHGHCHLITVYVKKMILRIKHFTGCVIVIFRAHSNYTVLIPYKQEAEALPVQPALRGSHSGFSLVPQFELKFGQN